MFTTCKV